MAQVQPAHGAPLHPEFVFDILNNSENSLDTKIRLGYIAWVDYEPAWDAACLLPTKKFECDFVDD